MEEINDLMTIEEMSTILKIKPNTLRSKEWREKTGCPMRKISKRLYTLRGEFWDWVKTFKG